VALVFPAARELITKEMGRGKELTPFAISRFSTEKQRSGLLADSGVAPWIGSVAFRSGAPCESAADLLEYAGRVKQTELLQNIGLHFAWVGELTPSEVSRELFDHSSVADFALKEKDFDSWLKDWQKRVGTQAGEGLKVLKTESKKLESVVGPERVKKFEKALNDISAQASKKSPIHLAVAFEKLRGALDLTRGADDLGRLVSLHSEIQKGRWPRAQELFGAVRDFRLSATLDATGFGSWRKSLADIRAGVLEEKLWTQFREGKKNLDTLLGLLKSEHRRLESDIQQRFQAFEKTVVDGVDSLLKP
jgi:hypothetical protein